MKNADYDIVAKFYDKVIGVHSDVQDYVLKIIARFNKNAKSLLELGCGTGKNLENLQTQFDITGIDISAEMLELAKKKISGAEFILGDLRGFDLGKKFDVIICMYDTLNHLTLFREWEKLFADVNKHLEECGLFIFDINTQFKLRLISEISPLVYSFDDNFLIVEVKKKSNKIFNWNLKIFDHQVKNKYKLHEVNIKEASFEINKIKVKLNQYFVLKKIETENLKKITSKSERVYFVCQKRPGQAKNVKLKKKMSKLKV